MLYVYWIAFSLLPLKLYAWPCKCILEIHSWLQRKMVYVICELTWFFQKQKSTNIGTLLCKLVVYVFVRCHPKHLKIAKQLADWLYIPINLELCQAIRNCWVSAWGAKRGAIFLPLTHLPSNSLLLALY